MKLDLKKMIICLFFIIFPTFIYFKVLNQNIILTVIVGVILFLINYKAQFISTKNKDRVFYLIFAFILTGVLVLSWAKEESFTSYLPPSGYEIDHGKMNRDLANGVGREEVKRRTVRGYYNVRKK